MSELLSIRTDGADRAREALEACVLAGGVAVFPADGLYGLACDPASGGAIRRIHELKGRPAGRASAVLYFDPLAMREVLGSMGPETRRAVSTLLPGPVTAVVANPDRRYPLACGDDPGRLGLRLIESPLSGARCPVFQTSANPSGEPAPADFRAIDLELVRSVDLAIDGGTLTGKASTVVDLSRLDAGGDWSILREGGMAEAEVAARLAPDISR